ncbi:MAG: LysE family transporter [Bacteroidota bacterium]
MSIHPALAFFIGTLATFIGTLPFGPINLSVVDTTLRKNLGAALWMALAAAIIEIVMAFIALHCSIYITMLLGESQWTKIGAILLFVVLGLFFFFKKPSAQSSTEQSPKKGNDFWKGLGIAAINPQAIPFWIFVLTYLQTAQMIELSTQERLVVVLAFLFGVAVGKFGALALFGLLSQAIKSRATAASKWMNKIIGGILLLIGLGQALTLFIN